MRAATFFFDSVPSPAVMGIVNITPDSFSDGNEFFAPDAALAHAGDLIRAGAVILDLGAEATSFFRKGVVPTSAAEQLRRLLPVVRELARNSAIVLSIDTRSAEVAEACLQAGARIINDVSAGTHDPGMLATVARQGAAVILMHISPGYPTTPAADDADIVQSVAAYLAERLAAAESAGIDKRQIAIDPGVGFGKTMADNWRLTLRAQELTAMHPHVVLGISRKRFLETDPPESLLPPEKWHATLSASAFRIPHSAFTLPPHPRDRATAAATQLAIANGIPLHRLHDPSLAKTPPNR